MRMSSLIPDVESMLKLGPEQFGCALLKVINSLPEGMQHRHNYLLMPEAIDGYPPELHEKAKQAQSETWEWLKYNGYIAPRIGNANSEFIYITDRGKQFLNDCDQPRPSTDAPSADAQSERSGTVELQPKEVPTPVASDIPARPVFRTR
jgi:hypothetical protein